MAMEACGGAHHWARELVALGHEVKLLPPKAVRPFVAGNKNDSRDEHGIWTAVQQPRVKEVAVKSEEQQAVLTLNRMRQHLVKCRTAQINGLRGSGRIRRNHAEGQIGRTQGDPRGLGPGLGAITGDRHRDVTRAVGAGVEARRADPGYRTPPRAMASGDSGEPAHRRDSGGGDALRDSSGGHDG